MSKLPDGTNPYGRLLDVMRRASPGKKGIVLGEYLGKGKFLVGDMTLVKGDYVILQNTIVIDDEEFSLPALSDQEHVVKRKVTHFYYASDSDRNNERKEEFEFTVKVPAIKKGDAVIAYQFKDEQYVILGKVVG